jgi:hypothetical protein
LLFIFCAVPSDRRKPLEGRRVLSAFAGAPTSAVAVKPPELGWGDVAAGLFGIEPGSEQTVNWGEFVFIARCKNPAGCKGSATLTGTGSGHTSAVAAKAKPAYAKVSFSVAGNTSRRVVLKLGRPAATILRKKHKLSGVLTVTIVRPGATPAKLSHALTIHLVSKRRH